MSQRKAQPRILRPGGLLRAVRAVPLRPAVGDPDPVASRGRDGGLTFPLNGVSLHWFANLFETQAVGDFGGSFPRSLIARA